MGLTTSDFIEEILYDAHKRGVAKRVFELARKYSSEGKSQSDAYDLAYREAVSEIKLLHNEKVNL
jgi:hypothetical protein